MMFIKERNIFVISVYLLEQYFIDYLGKVSKNIDEHQLNPIS